jgi:hypothetical protein
MMNSKKHLFPAKLLLSLFVIFLGMVYPLHCKSQSFQLAVLKYGGGGDWYANPTSLPNLVRYCNTALKTSIQEEVPYVEVGSPQLFEYPLVHMTGHGNVVFNDQEAENLRNYLIAGGFLHIDDNYGMDPFIRPEMKKVFPELDWVELPFDHPIYHQYFNFNSGLPKIHAHDEKPPQGFGLEYQGRLIVFYSYESDLGDGWEDPEVHDDPPETRKQAFQMGSNIISYVFTQYDPKKS